MRFCSVVWLTYNTGESEPGASLLNYDNLCCIAQDARIALSQHIKKYYLLALVLVRVRQATGEGTTGIHETLLLVFPV